MPCFSPVGMVRLRPKTLRHRRADAPVATSKSLAALPRNEIAHRAADEPGLEARPHAAARTPRRRRRDRRARIGLLRGSSRRAAAPWARKPPGDLVGALRRTSAAPSAVAALAQKVGVALIASAPSSSSCADVAEDLDRLLRSAVGRCVVLVADAAARPASVAEHAMGHAACARASPPSRPARARAAPRCAPAAGRPAARRPRRAGAPPPTAAADRRTSAPARSPAPDDRDASATPRPGAPAPRPCASGCCACSRRSPISRASVQRLGEAPRSARSTSPRSRHAAPTAISDCTTPGRSPISRRRSRAPRRSAHRVGVARPTPGAPAPGCAATARSSACSPSARRRSSARPCRSSACG